MDNSPLFVDLCNLNLFEETMNTITNYLASKPHYLILDGLRGVAAVVILIYHLCEACGIVLGHGYLGVDFFYALSGFVIGYAYDERWGKMSLKGFFSRRIVRLHPMFVMGTLLGLLFYYFGASAAFPFIGESPWWMVILLFFYCCLMLPMPNCWDIRGWQDFNSFNGNSWSLYWEYLANILYALVFRFLPTAVLVVVTAVAAVGTIDITFNIDMFGLLDGRVGAPFTVNGGWSLTPAELYVGAVRLMYPFLVGMLLSRFAKFVSMKGAFVWCSIVVVAMLLVPQLEDLANGIYESVAILVLIPFVILLGAGGKIKNKLMERICTFLGDISYPLYITHLPFIYMMLAWTTNHPEASESVKVMLAVSMFVVSVAVACASLKLYDMPLRKWLTKHWLERQAK